MTQFCTICQLFRIWRVTRGTSAQPEKACHPVPTCAAVALVAPVYGVRSREKLDLRGKRAQPIGVCHPSEKCAADDVSPVIVVRSRLSRVTRGARAQPFSSCRPYRECAAEMAVAPDKWVR